MIKVYYLVSQIYLFNMSVRKLWKSSSFRVKRDKPQLFDIPEDSERVSRARRRRSINNELEIDTSNGNFIRRQSRIRNKDAASKRRSRSVSPVLSELKDRLAKRYLTLSYNNISDVRIVFFPLKIHVMNTES